jgi:hypothetical protein
VWTWNKKRVAGAATGAVVAAGAIAYGITQSFNINVTISSATPPWLPVANNSPPTIYADLTTEGTSNHYWYGRQSYVGFASWLTALGGTFSRASTATYLQSGVVQTAAANVPRFPTDIYGNPLGIRLTGSATNLAIHSQTFENAAWVKTGSSISTGFSPAPDGTATGGGIS